VIDHFWDCNSKAWLTTTVEHLKLLLSHSPNALNQLPPAFAVKEDDEPHANLPVCIALIHKAPQDII